MSGKAYTMKEMKAIVDYLTEHKAYSETKGRKMWMDLQDSKVTNRTWQSLKETFIKRILPDISNPYYKLTTTQISSFKQGYDIEARISNRLQIRSASRDSNVEGESHKNTEEPDSHKDKTGEDLNQSKSDLRASTETLVLENYEAPEEKQEQSPSKSLRELITYSEPLTPMLQAVIDDFASDDGDGSNDEPKMQIVEQPDSETNAIDPDVILLDGSNSDDPQNSNPKESEKTSDKAPSSNKNDPQIDESKSKEEDHGNSNNDESSMFLNGNDTTSKEQSVTELKKNNKDNLSTENKLTQNASNSTTDTFLPENQEAYKNKETKIKGKAKANLKVNDAKHGKRRASSQDTPSSSKKRLLDNEKQTNSDVDILKKANKKIDLKKLKENIPEIVEPSTDKKSKSECTDQNTVASGEKEKSKEIVQTNETSTPEIENPCLRSVSLYEEQFSNKKYTDSENSNVEGQKKEKNKSNQKVEKAEATKTVTMSNKINEVVVLKSNSESLSDSNNEPPKRVSDRVRQQRDRALANVFGFTSGGVNRNRRRGNSFRKSRNSRTSISRNKSINISSDSSEWTSDTGSEYVSPPRGRRNRQTRKYLKPKSARVLSLEEEGGLFVMYGKKIYPVVKDGKIIKNYISYTPEDDVDAEESYWKLKYVEEKKRTAELTKLLNQGKDRSDTDTRVPVIPSTSINKAPVGSPSKKETEKVVSDNIAVHNAATEENTVKLKVTKNNEEVQLEGHWSHVNPVLAQVLQLLQRPPAPPAAPAPRDCASDASSVKSASVVVLDQDVSARVDELEKEIFKEIKQKENEHMDSDKEDSDVKREEPQEAQKIDDETDTKSNENITKRKGRPRKSDTTPTASSPAKKSKQDAEVQEESSIATRRTPRTSRKITDNNEVKENNTPKTRQNMATRSKKVEIPLSGDSAEVRFKFPSPAEKSTNKAKKETKTTRLRKSNSPTHFKIYTSPDNLSQNSIESTQGYVDSDPSPTKLILRKKRKSSITIPACRTRSQTRKRMSPHLYLTDDLSSDSSNSYQGPVKTLTFQNSTVSSEIYKSDSYQLLMNNNSTGRNRNLSQKLDKIDEIVPIAQETEYTIEQNIEALFNLNEKDSSQRKDTVSQTNTDSSSNVTMPTSPALSIVENISISRSMLNNTDDFVFDGELNGNTTERITLNNFMTPTVDVSMPLMEQECDIEVKTHDGVEYHYSLCAPKTSTIVSESFLNKINTVNIQDPTSDSINDKLKNLILESTKKKIQKNYNIDEKMEQDENINNDDKKSKSKKRSSTPRKRQSTRKLKLVQNEPCIEEEHMETCSQLSRKSCPPVLQICENTNNNNESIITKTVIDKPKNRKKKDIIKVKIDKPKSKRKENKPDSQEKEQQSTEINQKQHQDKGIRNINQTDSGINETQSSIFLHISEDSVDLIHNHSETCLNAHDCLDASVKIVENSTKSIISIGSNSTPSNEDSKRDYFRNLSDILAQELYYNDAQDGTQMIKANSNYVSEQDNATTSIFHTPLGSLSTPDSLITEDLSDDAVSKPTRNTKWYLFSEDETSNTNAFEVDRSSGYGANLNEIFPITCAIPNLSTITEMSKDVDDNTRKFSEDTNTRNDFDSQSLFNI